MKLPYLPIYIDSFFRGAETASARGGADSPAVYLLSHAHTDHMAGLSADWRGGLLFTSDVTRELLMLKLDSDALSSGGVSGRCRRPTHPHSMTFADRCIALPMWERVLLLRKVAAPGAVSSSSAEEAVYVTLLPAFHIPGSVMLYFEAPYGRLLYTGDFKFDTESAAPVLTEFFRCHPVDHVYLDDTWLHLGVAVPTRVGDGGRSLVVEPDAHAQGPTRDEGAMGVTILSKLLNAAQLEEAVEALGRRLDAQRLRADRDTAEAAAAAAAAGRPCAIAMGYRPPPYKLRVYLHNQFGKEAVVQRIAERLGTRAAMDDARYARVVTVASALRGESVDDVMEGGSGGDSSASLRGACAVSSACRATSPAGSGDDMAHALTPVHEGRAGTTTAWRERDFYRFDARYVMSASQTRLLRAEIERTLAEGLDECALHRGDIEADGVAVAAARARAERLRALCASVPLVEVVGSRAEVSAAALRAAAEECSRASPVTSAVTSTGSVPHYGVIMSGWAGRRATDAEAAMNVWHVPTTLHCTPQEIMDFIALLRPRSVTPLHYRASRSPAVVMQRLGPLLRRPFVNEFFATDATALAAGGGPVMSDSGQWRCVAAPPEAVMAAMPGPGLRREPRRQGYRIARPTGASSPPHPAFPGGEGVGMRDAPDAAVSNVEVSDRVVSVIGGVSGRVEGEKSHDVPPPLSAAQLRSMCDSYMADIGVSHSLTEGAGHSRKRLRESPVRTASNASHEGAVIPGREDVSLASLADLLA